MMIPRTKGFFYKIRRVFWNYPYKVFGKDGVFILFFSLYKSLRPFSHIILFTIFFALLGILNYSHGQEILKTQKEILIEGVIVGKGGLSRINPLVPTNNQLETDLSKLIYLSLVRVDKSGEVVPVLASSWEQLDKEGKEFKFYLREDVYWHDGERFTADDVVATFKVLKALGGEEEGGITSKQADLAQDMEFVKLDNYTVLFKLSEINPSFFEDIDCGILPKHVLDKVSLSIFSWAKFNLNPVGTGPFVFHSYKDDTVRLAADQNYFMGTPEIKELRIVMFETGDEAVEALKNGSIHLLADPSTAILKDLETVPNIVTIRSADLYRRYWALYFNLKQGGPAIFADKRIRQAVSAAIDREEIISKVETAGSEAKGSIPEISWAYNSDATRFGYDPAKARELLEEAGWKKKEVGGRVVRMKDEEVLRLELSFLDRYDRELVAESIKSDLEKLGIVVNLDPRGTSDLNEALIATRNFEIVLYGVETPIDPDRIRLWHSDAIEYPGLNISSYRSERTGAVISEEKEIERISIIDAALENALLTLDREKRKGTGGKNVGYLKFQEILLDECPVVFLYHPVLTYAVHTRVKGIDLSEMTAPEERYLSILDWKID